MNTRRKNPLPSCSREEYETYLHEDKTFLRGKSRSGIRHAVCHLPERSNRRVLTPAASCLLLCTVPAGVVCRAADMPEQDAPRPNVILIYVDDMGYGDLSCYGHPTISTPQIDRLAAEGMKMNSFYAPAAVSSPSRAGLLTGRYPVRSGMYGDRESVLFPDTPRGLPEEETTLADLLRDAGYATALIGKWHQGHAHPYLPGDNGFDYFYGVYSPNNYRTLPFVENEEVLAEHADRPNLTRLYTERARTYIAAHREQPFFLFLSHAYPHLPVMSSEAFEHTSRAGRYGDAVEELDWSVGQIMASLRENGLAENTLVIFTSDNGPAIKFTPNNGGSAGHLRGGKGSAWEGGFRVPGIFWYPSRILPGSVCMELSTQLDLLPTLARLCGAAVPDDRPLDGVDLLPMLTEKKKSVRREFAYYRGSRLAALREGRHKAIFEIPGDWYTQTPYLQDTARVEILIFDLDQDPGERRNIAPKRPDLVEKFSRLREEYRRRVDIAPSINDERPFGSHNT